MSAHRRSRIDEDARTTRDIAMRKLSIDQAIFVMAFERDVDYEDHFSLEAHLDLVIGEVEWPYEADDDATMDRLSSAGVPSLLRQ